MHAKTWGASASYLLPGSAPGFVQRITCNSDKTCTKGWLPDGVRQPRLTGKTYEDAQYSRNCSPECHLRSRGGRRRASRLVSPGKGLPTLASTCCDSWPTEHAEGQGRLPRSS